MMLLRIAALFGLSSTTLYAIIGAVFAAFIGTVYLKGRSDGYASAQVEELRSQIATRDKIISNMRAAAELSDKLASEATYADSTNETVIQEISAEPDGGPGCVSPGFLRQLERLR